MHAIMYKHIFKGKKYNKKTPSPNLIDEGVILSSIMNLH